MTARVEFWFEFASTYSYAAAFAVEERARERGVRVVWRSFLLAPIFGAQGWRDSPFNIYPAKGAYMWRDLARVCARQGLPLKKPTVFPRSGLLAARIACRHGEASWCPEFVRRIYAANFQDDEDISSSEVVGRIVESLSLKSAEILADAQTQPGKDALRAQTEQAVKLGIFGAPTFAVDGEIFWGGDRLGEALDWAIGERKVAQL
ncbi:MAG: 2-hydroxychromene-2-carboxylate isomerase [Alphaproteobacteria bacterium]|nr:2-hydroxychromene-2-carboxylate isomerase [Alphaproteobacteria bacterium]